jgi:VIT1/CCC1 family predicted Fe2+/Mn2+ transporter
MGSDSRVVTRGQNQGNRGEMENEGRRKKKIQLMVGKAKRLSKELDALTRNSLYAAGEQNLSLFFQL